MDAYTYLLQGSFQQAAVGSAVVGLCGLERLPFEQLPSVVFC